jgi:hypothetical protein
MARPAGLSASQLASVREISGAIAADSGTLVDATFPVASALSCQGFETVWVGVEIDGGSSPTAAIEVLVRDGDAATDGKRWKRLLVGAPPGVTLASAASAKTPALDGTSLYELRVDGRLVFFRVDAVTNPTNTTAMRILAMGGKPRTGVARP